MQLKDVSRSYGIAFIVAISVYFLKYLPISYWLILPIQIVLGSGLIIIICEIIGLNEYNEIKSIIINKVKKTTK